MGAAVGTDEEEMCAGLMAFHCEREERKVQVAGWSLEVRDYLQQRQSEGSSHAEQVAEMLRQEKIKALDEQIKRIKELQDAGNKEERERKKEKNAEVREKRLQIARRKKEEWMEREKIREAEREKVRKDELAEIERLEREHREEMEKIERAKQEELAQMKVHIMTLARESNISEELVEIPSGCCPGIRSEVS